MIYVRVGKSENNVHSVLCSATLNIKGDRVKTTVGIPGNRLSYSESTHVNNTPQAKSAWSLPGWIWLVVIGLMIFFWCDTDIPELSSVDLEKYRSKSKEEVRVTVVKP